jgi:hypothetical protein
MFFSRKVEVTFVDAASGAVIAGSKMEPEQLPETFLVDTTLHLGDEDWTVLRADPPTRAEFSKTRRLVLTLQRVEQTTMMDPRQILFSLPTLNDRLPDDGEPADGSEAVLAEDDWRQVELVSAGLRAAVDEEIRAITAIHESHRRGPGFDEIHVRGRIEHPLGGGLPPDALHSLGLGAPRALRLDRHGDRVRGGFAHLLAAGDWLLYGVAGEGAVTVLGLHPGAEPPSDVAIQALEALAERHDLIVVDWCRCTVGEPGLASFAATFA